MEKPVACAMGMQIPRKVQRISHDRLQESLRVVPMHPLEGGELDVLETTPGPASMGHLGFVEADDGSLRLFYRDFWNSLGLDVGAEESTFSIQNWSD